MSFNQVVAHRRDRYVEAVIDGHEDWESAAASMDEIVAQMCSCGLDRVLLDFTAVSMRMSRSDISEIAHMFDASVNKVMEIGIVPEPGGAHSEIYETFLRALEQAGHAATLLPTREARDTWIVNEETLSRTG